MQKVLFKTTTTIKFLCNSLIPVTSVLKKEMNKKLEIAVFNYQSALYAQSAGADRIELCIHPELGGISPGKEMIELVMQTITIPVNVMVRPRGGNFDYTSDEYEAMKREINYCKQQGVNGVVFGILTEDRQVDELRCKELVSLAHPLKCTFHRAFDECELPGRELEKIIACGFSHVLSSGTKANAVEGAKILKQFIEQVSGRIVVMPGGGVRTSNLKILVNETSATEYHSSALTNQTEIADTDEIENMKGLIRQ